MNDFERLVGDLEYPMFIVTSRTADGEPLGCLVGFTTQASIDPARFIVCLSHKNRTFRDGGEAAMLGVHAVPADAEDL
jgi:flavin reductase (DIM6/NTAB) family NADH-FMN oxidoreductase RutF